MESLGESAPFRDVATLVETGEVHPANEQLLRSYVQAPLDVHPSEWAEPCPDYADHPERQSYLRAVVAAMDSARVEALVYPSWTHPPAHIDRAREEYRGDNSQLVAPATGMPALTVPMGFTYGSLPAGLQILGRPYSEARLFELAHAYEQDTRHRRPPGGFPELDPPSPR